MVATPLSPSPLPACSNVPLPPLATTNSSANLNGTTPLYLPLSPLGLNLLLPSLSADLLNASGVGSGLGLLALCLTVCVSSSFLGGGGLGGLVCVPPSLRSLPSCVSASLVLGLT